MLETAAHPPVPAPRHRRPRLTALAETAAGPPRGVATNLSGDVA